MNYVGQGKYLLYGGITAASNGNKVQPNGDIFTLRMARHDWVWEKQVPSGEIPPPRA